MKKNESITSPSLFHSAMVLLRKEERIHRIAISRSLLRHAYLKEEERILSHRYSRFTCHGITRKEENESPLHRHLCLYSKGRLTSKKNEFTALAISGSPLPVILPAGRTNSPLHRHLWSLDSAMVLLHPKEERNRIASPFQVSTCHALPEGSTDIASPFPFFHSAMVLIS
ncbi:hypothetical protein AVEN_137011-1 [Araneus ventricosus]|uniref:Uncharacterized protein n=1 Tax=Araneus ventricosus TaxID=182803 RepID=A0A4Y2R5Z4_ARAVE|nr:hypothetical protein AVEN_137011-1 [Araneus ventricosus]